MGSSDLKSHAEEVAAKQQKVLSIGALAGKGPAEPGPATPSRAFYSQEALRILPRVLSHPNATAIMRELGEVWIPKLEDEEPDDYKERLKFYFVAPFYAEAVEDLADRMFSAGLELEDAPPRVEELWDDVDNQGTDALTFFYRVALEAIGEGLSAVFVDYPQGRDEGEILTIEQERALGRRPYLVHVKARHLIEALPRVISGRKEIARARLCEALEIPEANFSSKVLSMVRVLLAGQRGADILDEDFYARWQLYEEQLDAEGNSKWVPTDGAPMKPPIRASISIRRKFSVPFLVPFQAGETGFFESAPTMLPGANLNLQHLLAQGDLDYVMHLANTPSQKAIGVSAEELGKVKIGPHRVKCIDSDNPRADLLWHEVQGSGMALSKDRIEGIKEDLRSALKDPLVRRATTVELATARKLDERRPMSRAQVWAIGFARAATQCLEYMAAYRGEESGGTVKFPDEAMKGLIDPANFDRALKMFALDALDIESLQKAAKSTGALPPEHEIEESLERLGVAADREEAEGEGLTDGDETDVD